MVMRRMPLAIAAEILKITQMLDCSVQNKFLAVPLDQKKEGFLVQAISQLRYKSGQILTVLRASHTGTLSCPGNKRIISSCTRREIWY